MGEFLARWQFGLTTIFHFFFVPVTIGLCFIVATMQTLAYKRQDESWDRLSRFFGRLFLINIAVGVVTGIVLEFQFGMNWSAYSIFVGNIFGAPLAIEGLLAFFLESTFVGLWIFGRNRLSARLHLATIWAVSVGTLLSAFFILAANSWMQHPVGYRLENGKAVLTSFWAVLGNSTLWAAFAHTIAGALVTAGALVLGIAAWRARRAHEEHERATFLRAARFAAALTLVSVLVAGVTGDLQARFMDSQQPMKMAAAEAIYNTKSGASFSILTIGDLKGNPVFQIRIPHLLSMIADLSWNGQVRGVDQIQAAETAKHGTASYVPVLWITYWSFRLMVGAAVLLLLLTLWGLVLARREEPCDQQVVRASRSCRDCPPLPRQHHRLDLHRGRTPALARLRPHANREGSLRHDHGRRDDHARRLRGPLRPARSRRRRAHVPRRARQDLPEADSTGTPAGSDLVY